MTLTDRISLRPAHSRGCGIAGWLSGFLSTVVLVLLVSCSGKQQTEADLNIDPALGQAVFATPDAAAQAFVTAVSTHSAAMLVKLLGDEYRTVLPLDEVASEDIDNFLAAWSQSHTLLPDGEQRRLLAVGEHGWTLPVPIAQGDSGWYFDVPAGEEMMRIRRIGRNELAVLQAVLAYYDAQTEYAQTDRNGDGALEYAQKFISSPGSHDGLYWETPEGQAPSPLGPLFADVTPEGAYHGYFYKMLTAQGPHARGGTYDYRIGERMTAGFALVAWPAVYGDTGVMTFIVSHDGTVYEQDLGEDSAPAATAMQAFDPGPGWTPVADAHGALATAD